MKLSAAQIERIRSYVASRGVQLESLQDDIVDHLCCILEEQDMPHSWAEFDERLETAVQSIAPHGLSRLQLETFVLTGSTKIIYMKKMMYLVGLFSAIASTMGLNFKLLHLPGADQLLTYGLMTFTLVFLPFLMVDKFKSSIQSLLSEKLRILFGFLSAVLTGSAIVLRLFQINTTADWFFIIGAAIFSFGFLPFTFFTLYKKAVAV